MASNEDIQRFVDKVKQMEKGEKLDLSSGEDLSVAIMNLISIEEHLFFSGGKTGKTKYYDLLNQVRELRKLLLKDLVKDYEGEAWCISKHLLAASMRLMEVGTKAQTKGDNGRAVELFKQAYDLYSMFWRLNLGVIKPSELRDMEIPKEEKPLDMFEKMNQIIKQVLNCCKE